MTNQLSVEGKVVDGVAVLTIDYGFEQMLRQEAATEISVKLIEEYKKQMQDPQTTMRSCVVVIKAETAGSPLVRALFELYKEVNAGTGQVVVASFPADYIDSLTFLGLTDLDGFETARDETAALAQLR
jgi:hypothetical protein